MKFERVGNTLDDETSDQYLQWESFSINSQNRQQILIPPKFGNGFLVMSDEAVFHYKQFTIKWNDPLSVITIYGGQLPIRSDYRGTFFAWFALLFVVSLVWLPAPSSRSLIEDLWKSGSIPRVAYLYGALCLTGLSTIWFSPKLRMTVSGLLLASLVALSSTDGRLSEWAFGGGRTDSEKEAPAMREVPRTCHLDKKDLYFATIEMSRFLAKHGSYQQMFYWYTVNDPLITLFTSVSSTYLWGYRLLSEKFPELPAKDVFANVRSIAFLGSTTDKFAEAGQVLQKAGYDYKFTKDLVYKYKCLDVHLAFFEHPETKTAQPNL